MNRSDGSSNAPEGARQGMLRWPGGELDLRVAAIRSGGLALDLDRSSYEVLLALLLRAGQVLGKDELLEVAWPGRVVSENSLAKAISRLRKELGELAGAPLQSVHGYGYRWAGEVQWIDTEQVAAPATPLNESQWVGEAVPERPGWRFTRLLGRGAHSVVILAESDVGLPPRAIKLGIGEIGFAHVRREVALHRYLSALGHSVPGLATALGWQLDVPPVFVEYRFFEEGDLGRWMAARGDLSSLPLRHRLGLVAQIAETLAELHSAGVVHQDLKPGNVFVTADPACPEGWRTWLADLGGGHATPLPQTLNVLADFEALEPLSPSDTGRAGSAMYCSPEVLAGEYPTQRSDVFALGVLLYQMAVGDLRRPLVPGWESDIEDPVLREDIRSAATLRAPDRLVSASLLASNLRALDERRLAYQEAQQEGERQRAADLRFQTQRRRLRAALVAAAALMVGLGMAIWAGVLAMDARRAEEQRRVEAQAVLGFLTGDMLTRADPYAGGNRDVSLRGALDAAAGKIDERLDGKPEAAAAVHDAVAKAYKGWGEFAKAAVHQNKTIEALLQTATQENPLDSAPLYRELCQLQRLAGDLQAAHKACDQAIEADLQALGAASDASVVANAKLSYEDGRCVEVIETLAPILASPKRRVDMPPGFNADTLWFTGLCLSRQAQDAAALDVFRELIRLQENDLGPDNAATAWAYADFSLALARAGRFPEAKAAVDRLQQIFDRRLGSGHADAWAVPFRRGVIAAGENQNDEAVTQFRLAFEGWRASLGEQHSSTLTAGTALALAMARAGRTDEAAGLLARQQLAATELLNGRQAKAPDFHEAWAETLLLLGRNADATAQLELFRKTAAVTLPADHPRMALAECLAGRIAVSEERMLDAGTALAACRAGLARLGPEDYRRRGLADAERTLDDAAR